MHDSVRKHPHHQHQAVSVGGTAPAGAVSGLPGPAPNTSGPHRNDLMNKLDPTVDSQHGGVQILGPGINHQTRTPGHGPAYTNATTASTAPGTTAGVHHPHPVHTAGTAGVAGTGRAYETEMGHNSRFGTTLDPQVDNTYTTTTPHGAHGGLHTGTRTGAHTGGHIHPNTVPQTEAYEPYAVGANNAVDAPVGANHRTAVPRSHVPGQATTTIHQGPVVQPGPASKTAGPHRSNLLNKLDPAVDSKETVSVQRQYRTG